MPNLALSSGVDVSNPQFYEPRDVEENASMAVSRYPHITKS